MRMTVIIMLAVALQVSARGLTQTVSISLNNAPLEKVFQEIKKQTGYTFFYKAKDLDNTAKISLSVKNATIEEVLNLCFKNQPLTYTIIEKTILVKLKSPNGLGVIPGPDPESLSTIDITGKVTDVDGNPLSGASVKVKGTSNGTTTHTDGTFILRGIDQNATLEISFVGYEPYTIAVNNRSSITASLKLNVITNPEIIINKGYYSEKQKTSVSNVGVVTAKDIEKQPVQNPVLALQGRVPGLVVIQGTGTAGGAVKVRIQGENSLVNGSDPLYVVDGVPIDAQIPNTGIDNILGAVGPGSTITQKNNNGNGSPLSYLNPLDIESIEVLKDADATAIYGSRAANGAILITTKKGKAGDMKVDVNMETGWGRVTRHLDMMNTRQYLDMRYEAFANDGINWRDPSVSANDLKVWDTTRYTNWQDVLLGGTAMYNNVNASVSGGSSVVRYLVSGTYHKETTVFPLPKDFADQKASVHFNLNANNNNQKFRMQFSGNYLFDANQLPWQDMTQAAIMLEPDAPPLLNADGSINWAPDANGNSTFGSGSGIGGNANVMVQQYARYVNKTYNLVSSLKLDYTILPGLNVGSSFGYNRMQTNDFTPAPLIVVAPELRPTAQRSASFGDRNIQSWIIEPQATYHVKINKGVLDVLTGGTFQDKKAVSNAISGFGQLSDDLLENINAAATVRKLGGSSSHYRYDALFGRVNYNWLDKYIVTVNARRDGSTRFGTDNRYHNFGSVGAAWLFSNEGFFKSRFGFISFGKLRGNYGTTGNDQIGDYQFMSLYNYTSNTVPYQWIVSLTPQGLPNPDLKWEETRKLQLGIDLGFWQDKLVLNANYVQNRSSNQLLPYQLPTQAGLSSYLVNFPAVLQNQNWEFIGTIKCIEKKDLTWSASINLTVPRNKLIAFPGLDSSTYSNTWRIGEPIDAGRYYHWLGVAQGTGDYLYAQANGHPTLTPDPNADRNIWISVSPKFYGGFQNSLTYKGIQLDLFFQFVKQRGFDYTPFSNGSGFTYPGMFAPGFSNQPLTVLDRWQKPGDQATVALYSTYRNMNRQFIIGSDRAYTDASYISLKNGSLSYDLPQKWVKKAHFRNLRIYLHGQNLIKITKYQGLDPETQNNWALPPLMVWTVGVQAGL